MSSAPYTVPPSLRTLRQSNIGMMLTCGRKLWLTVADGLPWEASKKMLMGTAFHKGVENLYRSVLLGDRVDLIEAKAEAYESAKVSFALADPTLLDLDPGESVRDATIQAGGLLLMGLDYYYEHLFPAIAGLGVPTAVEQKFEIDYRGFHLHGTVDLLDAECAIHDHKFIEGYLGKTWPESYLAQVGRYAWFLEMNGIEVPDVNLDTLSYARATRKKNPVIEHKTYCLADAGIDMPTLIRMGHESVDAALDMVEAGIFPRAGMNHFGMSACSMCAFKGPICQGTAPGSSAPAA